MYSCKGIDRYGRGGTCPPPIFGLVDGVHYHECPPNIWGVKSSQVVFICCFHGILFHQNAYCTLMLTKKLQLLGDFIPRPPYMALPRDPAGDFRPLDPLLCPPNREDRSTPLYSCTPAKISRESMTSSDRIFNQKSQQINSLMESKSMRIPIYTAPHVHCRC